MKYRVVCETVTNNETGKVAFKRYHIEQKKRFLWWTYWEKWCDDDVWDYEFNSPEEARRTCERLNKGLDKYSSTWSVVE